MFIVTAIITINRLYTVCKQRPRWKRNLAFAKWGFYFAGFSRTNFVRAFTLSHFNFCFFFVNKVIFLIIKLAEQAVAVQPVVEVEVQVAEVNYLLSFYDCLT